LHLGLSNILVFKGLKRFVDVLFNIVGFFSSFFLAGRNWQSKYNSWAHTKDRSFRWWQTTRKSTISKQIAFVCRPKVYIINVFISLTHALWMTGLTWLGFVMLTRYEGKYIIRIQKNPSVP